MRHTYSQFALIAMLLLAGYARGEVPAGRATVRCGGPDGEDRAIPGDAGDAGAVVGHRDQEIDLLALVRGGIGLAQQQVLHDRSRKQLGLLGYGGHQGTKVGEPQVAQVNPVEPNPTGGRIEEAGDQLHDGALPGAARAGDKKEFILTCKHLRTQLFLVSSGVFSQAQVALCR